MSLRRRGGWWVVAQVAVLAAVVATLAMWGSDWGPVARLAGWAIGGSGAVLAAWGLISLGPNLSPLPHPVPDGALVVHGPYRLARHPVYGGLVAGTVGLGLIDGNPAVLGLAALLGLVFVGKSTFEEARLLEQHPEYAAYRRRVRHRMLPWLW